MSLKDLEALGRTYHGGAQTFGSLVTDINEAFDRLASSVAGLGDAFQHPAWLVMAPERARILRAGLAYEAVRRRPGRSKLAAPGTRRKRGGGHKRGTS